MTISTSEPPDRQTAGPPARSGPASRRLWSSVSRSSVSSSVSRSPTAWASGVSMALVAALVLPTLGRQPLSWDEAVSATAAQRGGSNLVGMLRHTDAPLGLYYVVLHGWVGLGSQLGIAADNSWWLRLPSALGAIGAAGLLVTMAARAFGARVALVAGLLFAVHPMITYYAQDARPYTLAMLALLVSTGALLRALARPGAARWVCYVAASTLTLYLHLFAIFAFAAHGYLVRRRAGLRVAWALSLAAVLVLVAPLALLAHGQSKELGWIPAPSVRVVWSVLTHLAGGIPFVAAVAVALALLLSERRARLGESSRFLLIAAVLPPLALVAADVVTPDLVARYAMIAIPAGVTLLALAAVRGPTRRVTVVTALAGLCLLGATVVQLTHPYKYENFRGAADAMGDLAPQGADVVFLPISGREGFDAYSHLEPDLAGIRDVTVAATPATSDRIGGLDQRAAQIPSDLTGARTIFLLGDTLPVAEQRLHDPASAAQEKVLAAYRTVLVRTYGDVTLTMLTTTVRLGAG